MMLSGVSASLGGLSGAVANSAMLAMYDGEDVQHFGCHISEQLVIGSFETVDFTDGDEVKAVISRLDDHASFAHAVVRPKDGLLWMPRAISKGRWKVAEWLVIALGGLSVFSWLLISILLFFNPPSDGYWQFMSESLPILLSICLVTFIGVYRMSLADAKYAESLFEVLGFKRPSIVNLSPFSQARLGKGSSYMVYDLRAALRAYGSLSKAGRPKA